MNQALTIPGELPDLNQIINEAKSHWSAYRKEKNAYTLRVKQLARKGGLKLHQCPVRISFVWVTGDLRKDPDNVSSGGRKAILDGLEAAGVLRRDSRKWIVGFTDDFAVDKKNPRIEVELREE